MVDWTTTPPTLLKRDVFKNGEQGALNSVLLKKAALGELSFKWHSVHALAGGWYR
jgi:hypothetical protein